MERYFEKISFKQFACDIKDDKNVYEAYELPKRSSKSSAGYDFFAIEKVIIKPGQIVKIPTGYKAYFQDDEALFLIVRSSMGFKHNIRLCNQVGLVDADYYNNPKNEGHMYVALQNEGTEDFIIEKGDAYCQGVFMKYLTCGDEVSSKRTGGIGSTNKKEGEKDE